MAPSKASSSLNQRLPFWTSKKWQGQGSYVRCNIARKADNNFNSCSRVVHRIWIGVYRHIKANQTNHLRRKSLISQVKLGKMAIYTKYSIQHLNRLSRHMRTFTSISMRPWCNINSCLNNSSCQLILLEKFWKVVQSNYQIIRDISTD